MYFFEGVLMAEAVMEEALRVDDVVGGGGGDARDGFGAYSIPGFVAGIVKPCSIIRIHHHAVLVRPVFGKGFNKYFFLGKILEICR